MQGPSLHRMLVVVAALGSAAVGQSLFLVDLLAEAPQRAARTLGPSQSGPIAVSPDDREVWVANPDRNSVSVIDVRRDTNHKRHEIGVGVEPRNLAIAPNGRFVYVSNTVSGTVSVIRDNPGNPRVVGTIRGGTEPDGNGVNPNGDK